MSDNLTSFTYRRRISLSYGLFLGWLLSFLYNGPILSDLFMGRNYNLEFIAFSYISLPALFSIIMSFTTIPKRFALPMMKISLLVVLVGTTLLFVVPDLTEFAIYILAGILGVTSVLFIAGWGVVFSYSLPLGNMPSVMGATISIGYIIFAFNKFLSNINATSIGTATIFISLILSLQFTNNIVIDVEKIEFKSLKYCPGTIAILAIAMFFINIGGGVTQVVLMHSLDNNMQLMFILEIVMFSGFLLFFGFVRMSLRDVNWIVIAVSLLGVGFVLYLFAPQMIGVTYFITTFAYLFIDVILWSIVGTYGRIYSRPIKILFITMGANLFAVLLGGILGSYSLTMINGQLSIIVTAITILISFSIFIFVSKDYSYNISEFNKIKRLDLDDKYTKREQEIIMAMLSNLTQGEIAEQLFISINTLKTHSKNIYHKADVMNKKELIKKYYEEEKL